MFGYTMTITYMNLVTLLLSFFPSLLATENLQNHFFFVISSFLFRILAIYRQVKTDWCQRRLLPASAAAAPAVRELNWGGGYGVVVVQCWRHQ
jgi:hypothetical protein